MKTEREDPQVVDWVYETAEVRDWLESLGVVVNDTYRTVIDREHQSLRCWQFARDEKGRFMVFGGEIVRKIPFNVSVAIIPAFVLLDRYGAGPVKL